MYCVTFRLVLLCLIWVWRCDVFLCIFFFKQKTAYELRISDWSSDVCSSDLFNVDRGSGSTSGSGIAATTSGVSSTSSILLCTESADNAARFVATGGTSGDRKSVV